MGAMPHIDLLELPYFSGISIDHLVALVDTLAPEHFPAGKTIVEEHESQYRLYIVTKGSVAISKTTPDGVSKQLAKLLAPTLFGEIGLFCRLPAVARVIAETPVDTFCLTRDTYDRLFAEENPALHRFTLNVARVACHRLAIADEMLARTVSEEDMLSLRSSLFTASCERLDPSDPLGASTGAFRVSEIGAGK